MEGKKGVSMIITTFNVRGLGGRIKRNKIRDLVRQNNIDLECS
jgi:hypothetical protein